MQPVESLKSEVNSFLTAFADIFKGEAVYNIKIDIKSKLEVDNQLQN